MAYGEDDWTEIEVDNVLFESDEAVLVVIEGEEHWLPQSQLDEWPDIGNSGSIMIKTWLAEKREFI